MTALFSFCQSENETPIHLFHGCIKTNLLWYWYKLKKSLKTKIDLPVNTPQSAICLCIPGVCIVCLHMYLHIFKYICSETILAIFDTVIH